MAWQTVFFLFLRVDPDYARFQVYNKLSIQGLIPVMALIWFNRRIYADVKERQQRLRPGDGVFGVLQPAESSMWQQPNRSRRFSSFSRRKSSIFQVRKVQVVIGLINWIWKERYRYWKGQRLAGQFLPVFRGSWDRISIGETCRYSKCLGGLCQISHSNAWARPGSIR